LAVTQLGTSQSAPFRHGERSEAIQRIAHDAAPGYEKSDWPLVLSSSSQASHQTIQISSSGPDRVRRIAPIWLPPEVAGNESTLDES
jgi:hypothetical protein